MMNENAVEYYERLLSWVEAMRLAHRVDGFIGKLTHKEEELQANEDPHADDFGDAAYYISEGVITVCEILLRNAVAYGSQNLGLAPYQGSRTAMSLLVDDLLRARNSRLDYYSGAIHAAHNDLLKHDKCDILSLEEIERRYSYKVWRKNRIRNGLGVGGGLFDEEWSHGTEGRPPLRDTIPWLEAWGCYLEAKEAEAEE